MPSRLFQQLAQAQLELLASSLTASSPPPEGGGSGSPGERRRARGAGGKKIKSAALYLPQENAATGQLEFLPAVLHPHPDADGRVFIAGDAGAKAAPSLPRAITKLPGFEGARSLIPGYPMVSSSATEVGVGAVEEVFCHLPTGPRRRRGGVGGGAALSVPLLSGSQTVGVLLVSPSDDAVPDDGGITDAEDEGDDTNPSRPPVSVWTESDREQVARAARSLSLALSMDAERLALQSQNRRAKEALSDSLHQLKNPLQALRTYGKLLQQRIADTESPVPPSLASLSSSSSLLELADHLLVQSDRLSERLGPVDWIVDGMDGGGTGHGAGGRPPLLLLRPAEERSLVRWAGPLAAAGAAGAGAASAWVGGAALDGPSALDQRAGEEGSLQLAGRDKDRVSEALLTGNRGPDSRLFLGGSPGAEMCFLEDVLDPVLAAFRAIAADRGVDFEVDFSDNDALPGVTVSQQAVQEAASNLLDNAFKYAGAAAAAAAAAVRPPADGGTRSRPRVRVRVRPNSTTRSPAGAPGATILVEDNGPGIPESEIDLVWRRGYRGEGAILSGEAGSGLGLGIARDLVEGTGGTLRVLGRREASRLGCLPGTAVEVVLFRDPPAPSAQKF
jgi:signal transduction histidine kinase